MTLCVLLTAVHGRERELVDYEDRVLALLPGHGARLLQRVRREDRGSGPYEIHVIEFRSEGALDAYLQDPARLALAASRHAAIAHTEVLRVEVVAPERQG